MNKGTSRLFLRAFEYQDLTLLNEWRSNEEFANLTTGSKYFISSEYDKKWIENKIFNNEKNIYLGICLNGSNKLIGYLSINNIDFRNSTAEWGGIVIGDKESHRNGYASEASTLMLDYVFLELAIYCIYGVWLETHSSSIRMGEKLGFTREGILRNRVFKSGSHQNYISMSLTRDEYFDKRA